MYNNDSNHHKKNIYVKIKIDHKGTLFIDTRN